MIVLMYVSLRGRDNHNDDDDDDDNNNNNSNHNNNGPHAELSPLREQRRVNTARESTGGGAYCMRVANSLRHTMTCVPIL